MSHEASLRRRLEDRQGYGSATKLELRLAEEAGYRAPVSQPQPTIIYPKWQSAPRSAHMATTQHGWRADVPAASLFDAISRLQGEEVINYKRRTHVTLHDGWCE